MIHHTVHFWLREDLSAIERAAFVEGVRALNKSAYVAAVRVGVPADTAREVVDSSYDVQLFVTFADMAAHDAYQSDDPVHTTFIDTFKDYWTKVLIYDSVEA